MIIENLIRKTRSCRRFYQNKPIKLEQLESLVNLGRLSASAGNLQPLKYIISSQAKKNDEIFSLLKWAEYLSSWKGPDEGEKPAGYIIVLADTQISTDVDIDVGIAAQSIMLGARDIGFAGCIINNFQSEPLRKILNIPQHVLIKLVIALGNPRENIVIENLSPESDVRYWRDGKGVHHVPKRSLDDVLIKCF